MKCPRCHTKEMELVVSQGIEVNCCPGCFGIWFEPGETESLLKKLKSVTETDTGGLYDAVENIDCPRGHAKLNTMVNPDMLHFSFEVCPMCDGVWFDAGDVVIGDAGGAVALFLQVFDVRSAQSRLEEAAYHVAYHGDDPQTEALIAQTVARLPDEVAEFVFDRCIFLSVGGAKDGFVIPGRIGVHPRERRSRNVWLIIVADEIPADDVLSIIAHEIAHAWLRHDRLAIVSREQGMLWEIQACELAQEWGFTGAGTDAEYHAARLELLHDTEPEGTSPGSRGSCA
jgi:Zn-finger nucleic acid-binding protein